MIDRGVNVACLFAFAACVSAAFASPLDGISLEVPQVWPCKELSRGNMKAIWLEGEPLKGRPTKVFAYVVLPKDAGPTNRVPGMVLAHGGAGSAYPGWAAGWAEKGYAAIIPDTCGCIPMKAPGASWMRSGVGGPEGWGRTDLVNGPVGDQWPYHAVGAVVRAHSYLRSLPEVDPERIGITGISWGGFITQLAAATDARFKFAAPVYACGFYEEFAEYTDFYKRSSFTLGMGEGPEADRLLEKWAAFFDPKLYVPKVKMPLFWFASAGDKAFPFDPLQKTVRLAPDARLAVRVGMKHGHGKAGDSMPELHRFADQMLKGGAPVPTVSAPLVKDGVFTAVCSANGNRIRRAELIWCTDDKPVYATEWKTRVCAVSADGLLAEKVPVGAKRIYANFVFGDELKGAYYPDAVISSTAVTIQPLRGPEAWLEIMGGNVRKDGLRCDLEAIKSAGFSGVHFFHIDGHPGDGPEARLWPNCPEQIPCLSEKWDEVVAFLGAECERLGLALTVQNCPGWSQSGGPWVPLSACMREAVFARRDFADGETFSPPDVPAQYADADSDWTDIAVLAFPTPLGDTGAALRPVSVETNGDERIYRFDRPVTVRTITLPGLHQWNSAYGYHPPWRRVSIEAKVGDGWADAARTSLPTTSWRDYVYTFTLACDERTSDTWRYRVEHDYPLKQFGEPTFYSCARQTDWESKSGLVLRQLLREKEPRQDRRTWLKGTDVIDLTGVSDWKVPAGRWTVLRVAHVNSKRVNAPAPKEATGWECDKLDPAGIEANFKGYVGRLLDGPLKGRMYGMMVDSWECFGQTWTPKMERYFREANGYEVRKLLPAIFGWVIDDHETTERFLTDWRRTLGALVTKNYYGRMAELAHGHGLTAYYESAFGDIIHGDLLEYWKYADAPMCEFWYPHASRDVGGCASYVYKAVRPCTSAAHIYGKTRVVAEAFTGCGIRWDEDFRRLQDDANRFFARGVTHLAFQSYTHAPDPNALPPGGCMGGYNGTPFTRLQTWWKHMPEFTGWLTRCEELLEAGRPAQDVLWYLGDAVDHRPDEDFAFPEGHRADYLNSDVLMNRLSVRDGRFVIPEGTAWKVLWVPDDYRMRPETRKRLADLAAAGGTVVWGGKDALATALSGLGKDVATEPALGDGPSEDFMWIHRIVDGQDRYFVAAGTNGYRGQVTFRAKGFASVLDPVSLERRAWANGTVLEIPPSRSVFVEFGEKERGNREQGTGNGEQTVEIEDWTLTFPDGRRLALDKPVSWSSHPDLSREERAFGGTAVYEATFEVADVPARMELDLGSVESVAVVYVNGVKVRTLWCMPFACDISRLVKPGRNAVRIEVTNTWRNRVIYDLGRPKEMRKTWIIYQPDYNPSAKDPFVPAGITGRVLLRKFTNRRKE